jgi:hypothetical protein
MSRKGNCWDNSVAESFFGSLKTECIFSSVYKTRDEAKRDIVDYIEMFYNSKRRHSYLGYLSPREFEKCSLGKCPFLLDHISLTLAGFARHAGQTKKPGEKYSPPGHNNLHQDDVYQSQLRT